MSDRDQQPKTWLHIEAEKRGMPGRTVDQVRTTLIEAEKYGSKREMALLMLRHGRLTDEARAFVASELES